MTTPRPKVFIGSSSEGKAIAEAIQVNLDYDAEVTIWSQGVFGLSRGTLESLVSAVEEFDFAILVLTPDDLVTSRDETQNAPRDNVLFELGLFMGSLGRDRCFITYDRRADIKLPSDLAGITAADFQPHSTGNLQAAVGSATTRIKAVMSELGPLDSNASLSIDSDVTFQLLADLLDRAIHQFLILAEENEIALTRAGVFGFGPRYEYSIGEPGRQSRGNGYFSVSDTCHKLADSGLLQVDLRDRVTLTERGKAFAEWLRESGYKASYFWSDHGGWGERPDGMNGNHPSEAPRNPLLPQND
ncbi:nucleotide-binding protein [Coraliomargarita algicola]|uniref:Nucleotide-binding protein n=1 Tax=Coraliomargarita algicola TaxID=3092156 RepID=A0ABZ0RE06_9BACT|nr:nucleotide-binding protein [Coraliomargarita sp. J2-16]WPJ94211.1 nucleotide-binding protein [Coraliomargarita sp. J2-16]